MVTKPLPEDGHADSGAGSQQPPRLEDMRRELWSPSESEASAPQAWATEPLAPPPLPPQDTIASPSTILRPGGIAAQNSGSGINQEEENIWAEHPPASAIDPQRTGASDIPAVLQPAGGAAPVSQTNPFKRKPAPGVASTPVNVPNMPSPTFDSPSPPTAALDNLSVADTSNNPWKPALDSARQSPAPPAPALLVDVADEDPGTGAWASRTGSAQASRRPSDTPGTGVPGMPGMPEEPSAGWDEVAPPRDLSVSHSPASAAVGSADNVVNENRQAWGSGEQEPKDKGKAPVIPKQTRGRRTDAAGEEWSLIDGPVPGQMSRQSTWENFSDEDEPQPSTSAPKKKVEPALPLLPREPSAEQSQSRSPEPPPQPPRPTASDKTETYHIKIINWYDANAPQNPRASPILVQNANGPCPLVALVNSLTLTSKPNTSTSLVETLRSREQVSLDLLLGAVVEELIIRTTDRELPDVTELYKFLKGLHTGMNVNPRYYPTEEASKALKRTSLTHLHPTERDGQMPGTFEHTREMQLYSTFAIPLIHGWIPSPEDNALASLKRHAASYEDVQNLLFREEELENKLSSPDEDGLTEDEQELYHDILTIKSFLDSSATQLTPFGLDVVGKSMLPGSVAILFRNDHFSTLYRHPQTLALLSLVTDAGYASHDEIVWESLVDVNGERAEFFSGDFRLVGGAHHQESSRQRIPGGFPANTNSSASSTAGGSSSNAGWTTVQSRRGKQTAGLNLAPDSSNPSASGSAPPVSPHEQEDRDLALALQLQEEEDERARVAEARRHRESQLSQQFIESQGSNNVNVHLTGNRNSSNNLRPGTAGTRRSSNASGNTTSAVSPVTVHGRRASGATAPRQQVVRPLVPPAGTPVTPNTGRRTGTGREEEEPPPPTYEQAAMDEPYTPPAGHPSHFASSLTDRVTGRRQRQSGSGGNGNGASPNTSATGAPGASGAGRGQGISPPVRPLRQGVPPPLSSGPINQQQRERDCIVM